MAQTDRSLGLVGNSGVKVPCRAASNTALTLTGAQTVDGVALVTGDRCLVSAQTSSVDNGIYTVDTGDWVRGKDCDGAYDAVNGSLVYITDGTTGFGFWQFVATDPIVFGTNAITFVRVPTVLVSSTTNVNTTIVGTGSVTITSGTSTITTTPTGIDVTAPIIDINADAGSDVTNIGTGTTTGTVTIGGPNNTTNVLGATNVLGDVTYSTNIISGLLNVINGDTQINGDTIFTGTTTMLGGGLILGTVPCSDIGEGTVNASVGYYINCVNILSNADHTTQTLIDAEPIAWDMNSGSIATITPSTGRTMGTPTHIKATTYVLHVINNGSGNGTIATWPATFKWPGGIKPVQTAVAAAHDIVFFTSDGIYLYGTFAGCSTGAYQ